MNEGPLIYLFDQIRVEPEAHRVFRAGRPIELEPKAFALLLQFIEHPQELLDRNRLLDAVWGHHHVTPAALNRIIALLRRALGDDVANPRYIQTVHGLGYRFAVTPTRVQRSLDADAWNATKESSSLALLDAFAARYSDTFFAELARARIDELKSASAPSRASALEQDAAGTFAR